MTDVKAKSTAKPSMLLVVSASAAGTAFEWYDFFVFVPLASILAKTFAAGLNEAAGYVFALGAFAAGFAFRPLGALIFGRIGDRSGRKGAFLVTVTMMGAATFLIGCLPSFAQAGVVSPILFILMRALQGVALGGLVQLIRREEGSLFRHGAIDPHPRPGPRASRW